LTALVLLSFALARPNYASDAWLADFRAFYCAGAVIAGQRDPYRTEPLRRCENDVRGFPVGRGLRFALPAPLPGYALAPFVPLSRLPYRYAAALWLGILLASLGATVGILGRLCTLRKETLFAALLLGALYSVFLGQTVPIVCAATTAAALFVTLGRDRSAAFAAALTMLEPHLGLPVCLALFVARPRARALLAGCGAAFALGSFALLGYPANLEYVRDVLPAHMLSEISNEGQYSLSYVAHLAGIGERAASRLGTLSYIVMLGAGILAGRVAAGRTRMPALLILVPPAFAVFGGPFVHVQQLSIALPAALVMCGTRLREARLCAVAVFLLAVPWDASAFLILNLPVVAAAIFVLAVDLFGASPIRAGLVSAISAASLVALLVSIADVPPTAIGPLDSTQGAALAEDGWRAYVEASFQSSVVPFIIAKVPGWSALILIALSSLGLVRAGTPAISHPVAERLER
jgi:energy-converting hydrogenase Eha subunit A